MPVYRVSVTAPNGNARSRTVAAHSADDALEAWRAEIELEAPTAAERRGFVYLVEAMADPDGDYERALVDAERRYFERRGIDG